MTGEERATIPLLGAVRCVALHPRQPFAACGDEGGGIYLIDLAGIEYGPIIVTATDLCKGAGYQLRCPFCNRYSDLGEDWLGTVQRCPQEGCGKPLKVNPFKVPA